VLLYELSRLVSPNSEVSDETPCNVLGAGCVAVVVVVVCDVDVGLVKYEEDELVCEVGEVSVVLDESTKLAVGDSFS